MSIDVRQFIEDGEELLYKHQGHASPYIGRSSSNPGDLRVVVRVIDSPNLRRVGNDVYSRDTLRIG